MSEIFKLCIVGTGASNSDREEFLFQFVTVSGRKFNFFYAAKPEQAYSSVNLHIPMHFLSGNKFLIIGHRGLPARYTENTLKSFMAARDAGLDAVELDVQLTSDGVPVVFHDFDLRRLAGMNKELSDMTWKEVSGIRLTGERRIPTLENVIKSMDSFNFFIELKTIRDDGTMMKNDLPDKVVNLILEHSLRDSVVVISFNPYSLMKVQELDRNIRIGIDYDRTTLPVFFQQNREKIHSLRDFDVLLPERGLHSDQELAAFIKGGSTVIPWTVDDPDQARRFKMSGCSGIITNEGDHLMHEMLKD